VARPARRQFDGWALFRRAGRRTGRHLPVRPTARHDHNRPDHGESAAAAAEQDLVGIDAITDRAVADIYREPTASSWAQSNLVAGTPAQSSAPPGAPTEARPVESVDKHPFVIAVREYLTPGKEDEEARRDTKDVRAIGYLFAEFLIEQKVYDLAQLRQKHFADFRRMFDDLPTHWGKSSRDKCLADYRKRGLPLPKSKRGISAKTWNKHLSNLNQVITFIRNRGGVVGEKGEHLKPSDVRAKIKKRGRGLRNPFGTEDLAALFNLPVFTGCAGWERQNPFKPGSHIYHRALYFAPMLLYYTGARRDEICGLSRDDVHLDAPIPKSRTQNDVSDIKLLRACV